MAAGDGAAASRTAGGGNAGLRAGPGRGSRPATGARAGMAAGGLRRLAEQVVQLGFHVDVVAFLARRDDLVGPAEEGRDLLGGRLEVRLAEGGGELDVQHAAGRAARGAVGRPDVDVAEALAALDAHGQQVAGEDPLDRLVQPDVERDADGVWVFAGVVEAGYQRHDRLLGNDEP